MLIRLEFDNVTPILVDHTQIVVEVEKLFTHEGKPEKWVAGIYVRTGVESRNEELGEQNRASFALCDRRLLYKKTCKTVEEANLFLDKTQEYVNNQINSHTRNFKSNADPRDLGVIESYLNQNNMLLEELITLLKPKPKAPRKKKEDSK